MRPTPTARDLRLGWGHQVDGVKKAAHVAVDQRALWMAGRVQADHVAAVEVIPPVPQKAEISRGCPHGGEFDDDDVCVCVCVCVICGCGNGACAMVRVRWWRVRWVCVCVCV